MKINIIGPCGGGKSTLARQIANKYKLKYADLDDIFVDYKNITPENVPLFSKDKIEKELSRYYEVKSWIMDGIYCVDSIMDKADLIILISHPWWRSLYWQWKRYFTDKLEQQRFGFRHNIILSQIILNQYLNRQDYYSKVGIKYPTMNHFKKIGVKHAKKFLIYPSVDETDLFNRLDIL